MKARNSYRQSLYVGAIRVAANILMIAALFFSMYQTARSGGPAEVVFCAWFFAIIIPVWLAAAVLIRLVRRRFPAEYQSLVSLPKVGPRLVTWRVAQQPRLPLRGRP